MINIVLFGPPGAGKGTQAARLVKRYNLFHLSTGDIFRDNKKNGTELGKLAQSFMDHGKLVPDDVTIQILIAEVDKHPEVEGFIFDGFPRTSPQAKALDEILAGRNTSISKMLALNVEEEELRKRLASRAIESGRADDANPEVIQKRIDVYNLETAPVLDFYTEQGKSSIVNGMGTMDDVTSRLFSEIDAVIV